MSKWEEHDMMSKVISLLLDVLTLDPEVQPRERMSSQVIHEYAALYRDGQRLAPIRVFQDGIDYWLADGFHRVAAAREAGLTEIDGEVAPGTKRDAILFSCGANKHGLGRTPQDKHRQVTRLLEDPEWRQWSNVEIAKHCGVAQSFVRKVRRSLCSEQSDDGQRRYRTKHGTIATMDTHRIGRMTPAPATADPIPPEEPRMEGDAPKASPVAPVPAAIDAHEPRERDADATETWAHPGEPMEVVIPAIPLASAPAAGAPPRLTAPRPHEAAGRVLILMDELGATLRNMADDGAEATAGPAWNVKLQQRYLRTAPELIEALLALTRWVEHHGPAQERSFDAEERDPRNADSDRRPPGGLTHVGKPPTPRGAPPASMRIENDPKEREESAATLQTGDAVSGITSDSEQAGGSSADEAGPEGLSQARRRAAQERAGFLAAKGLLPEEIAATLNTEGVPTATGRGRWNKGAILGLLRASRSTRQDHSKRQAS
jgi:hypothetical protein